MKAIRAHEAGGPEVLRVDDVPDPSPEAGELLIDVEAAGVNFVDIYQREGLYQVARPFTLGSEAAGTVRALGAGVSGFAVGDRVVSQSVKGAYAERARVPADRAVKIPTGVTSRQAAAVWLQGLTAHYLATSTFPLARGDRAFVIGTASTDQKRALARGAGADHMIDYTTKDFASETRRLTDGLGVAVVYDSVGKTTFDKSLDSLAKRGMLVLFGQSSGPVPPFDPQMLNRKGSLFLTRPTLNDYLLTRIELEIRARDLFNWIE